MAGTGKTSPGQDRTVGLGLEVADPAQSDGGVGPDQRGLDQVAVQVGVARNRMDGQGGGLPGAQRAAVAEARLAGCVEVALAPCLQEQDPPRDAGSGRTLSWSGQAQGRVGEEDLPHPRDPDGFRGEAQALGEILPALLDHLGGGLCETPDGPGQDEDQGQRSHSCQTHRRASWRVCCGKDSGLISRLPRPRGVSPGGCGRSFPVRLVSLGSRRQRLLLAPMGGNPPADRRSRFNPASLLEACNHSTEVDPCPPESSL